jgi:hypothetical protein
MPKLLRSSKEFEKILPEAQQCRVVARKEYVKLKLRTKNSLYVYITKKDEADSLLKKVTIDKVEY